MSEAGCRINVVAPDGMPCWMQHIGYWLHHQQTLVTGLLALLVGAVTVYYLRRQIAQQQELAKQQNDRKLRAVRAGLPFALSEIHDYSSKCIDLLCHFLAKDGSLNGDEDYDYELDQETLKSLPPIPVYPSEAFRTFQIVIEHAEIDDARKLQEIVAFGQIQHSRFQSLVGRLVHKRDTSWVVVASNVMSAIRDATGLRLHVERLYGYGRETSNEIPDLGSAQKANDALLWLNKGGEKVRAYVREHWPPDFPQRTPEKKIETPKVSSEPSDQF